MPLGMEVDLGPGHIVLDGVWGPNCPQRGTAPNFRSVSVVAKQTDDQDATWYGGRRRPTRH